MNKSLLINKLNIRGNKATLCSMALILILAFPAFMSIAPSAKAIGTVASPNIVSQPTNAYIAASPNPTGVNQPVEIIGFLTQISFTAGSVTGTLFSGLTMTITAPDGTNTTKGPYNADPISNAYLYYTPTQVGDYKLVLNYPGQWINGTPTSATIWPTSGYGYTDCYYEPSVSPVVTMTVQANPVSSYNNLPLPTEYWSNPVNAQNRNWATIMGDWLEPQGPYSSFTSYSAPATDRYQPYGTAPTTSHIDWTRQIWTGGIVGGAGSLGRR